MDKYLIEKQYRAMFPEEMEERDKLLNDTKKIGDLCDCLEIELSFRILKRNKLEKKIGEDRLLLGGLKNLKKYKLQKCNKLNRKLKENKKRIEKITPTKYVERCNGNVTSAHVEHYKKLLGEWLEEKPYSIKDTFGELIYTMNTEGGFMFLSHILNNDDKPVTFSELCITGGKTYAYVLTGQKIIEIQRYPNAYNFTIDTKDISYLIEKREF